jgi:hypothetical protein
MNAFNTVCDKNHAKQLSSSKSKSEQYFFAYVYPAGNEGLFNEHHKPTENQRQKWLDH